MADDNSSSEKTEQPTDKRRRDAREEGQVAHAKDLNMLGSIFTILICLYGFFNIYWRKLGESFGYILELSSHRVITINQELEATWHIAVGLLQMMLAPILTAGAIAGLINIIQIGGITFAKDAFKFDFQKLNVVSNFKSIFSKENFIKLVLQLFTISTAITVVILTIKIQLQQLLLIYNYKLPSILAYLMSLICKALVVIFIIYIVFGISELILEKRKLTKQLMMTKDDIKREQKDTDGNPEVKGERRRLHQEILEEESTNDALSNADFVLANPTHYAIAVMYKPKKWQLPVILIKAANQNALTIFKLAKKRNIPVIPDKWLTQQLYKYTNVGEFVPMRFLGPIADIIGKNIRLLPGVYADMQKDKVDKVDKVTNPLNVNVG